MSKENVVVSFARICIALLIVVLTSDYAYDEEKGIVNLTPLPFSQSGILVVKADISRMVLLAGHPVVRIELRNGAGKVKALADIIPKGVVYTNLNVHDFTPGLYYLHATVSGLPDGVSIGKPSSIAVDLPLKKSEWIAMYDGAKVLNNLVAELLRVNVPPSEALKEYKFTNPRNGWVFVGLTVKADDPVSVSIDGETEPAIIHDGTAGAREAMRYLSAGPHTLHLRYEGIALHLKLSVRAIPEMMVAGLGYSVGGGWPNVPILPCFGHYNMEYLNRIGLLDSINTIVERKPTIENEPYVLNWRRQGKRLLTHYSQWNLWQKQLTSPDEVFNAWSTERGLKARGYDGIIVDEFSGWGTGDEGYYPLYTEAIRRIGRNASFRGRAFYPYCGPMYPSHEAMDMLRAVVESGYKWAEETYLAEQQTEEAARSFMDLRLRQNLLRYEELLPGSAQHMITTLGFMSAPPETLNVHPSVDFKVYMDMQMHLLVTDPVFFGLYGILWYHNGYVDEEDLRWTAKLFRHYGIEGRTDRLTDDPYTTSHIVNADFDEGAKAWTQQPAEQGGISISHSEGYGILETRYRGGGDNMGDNFLLTRRSSKAPNRISQMIQGLVPGRTYSVKMFTADYDELKQGNSTKNPHSININIADTEMVPAKGFHQLFPSGLAGHSYGPFTRKNNLYLTYHRIVFRARASEALLTISDWANEKEPGGPIGQQLMHNFIEVQPYLEK